MFLDSGPGAIFVACLTHGKQDCPECAAKLKRDPTAEDLDAIAAEEKARIDTSK